MKYPWQIEAQIIKHYTNALRTIKGVSSVRFVKRKNTLFLEVLFESQVDKLRFKLKSTLRELTDDDWDDVKTQIIKTLNYEDISEEE